MIVCMCSTVSEKKIIDSYNKGNQTLTTIMNDLNVAQGCGTCQDYVVDIIIEQMNKNMGIDRK